MHLAALNGNGWMCWRLLEHCGYQILNEQNAERCTPLDLAKRGNASKLVTVCLTMHALLWSVGLTHIDTHFPGDCGLSSWLLES